MRKFMLVGGVDDDRAGLAQKWEAILDRLPEITGCLLHASDGQPMTDGANLIVELWTDAPELSIESLPAADMDCYLVLETVEKGAVRLPMGLGRGVTFLSLNPAKPGLAPSEVENRYASHGALALQVHVGMDRYVRNNVIGKRAGTLPLASLSVLHFPTIAEFRDRLFRYEDGRRAIMADVDMFLDVANIQVMTATTSVLR